jgi:hypothetical protein
MHSVKPAFMPAAPIIVRVPKSFAQDQTKVAKADKHRPLVWILLPTGHRARDFTKLYVLDTGAKTPAHNLPALAAHKHYRLRPRVAGQYG